MKSTTRPSASERLAAAIEANELAVYVYSYPSKRAYRPLSDDYSLEAIWQGVSGPVNLYLHVPFCGYRCSFCTLFLTTSHTVDARQRYVDAVTRQIAMYGDLIGHLEVVSLYIGGGTPTVLTPAQFETLFGALHRAFPSWRADAEVAVEGSPDTMTRELLGALKSLGVNRISMGLQTLDPVEAEHVGRRYGLGVVHAAVEAIDAVGFENVNYDLIYGIEGQTRDSWLNSLRSTVGFGPGTVTLYPVVVRPLTGIVTRHAHHGDRFMGNGAKYALYSESVDYLADQGFRQNSFVRFSRRASDGLQQEAFDFAGLPLVGFGAGSRSYTAAVHYGTDFAVRRRETQEIITDFAASAHRRDEVPGLGFVLGVDEQKRRHCILNLSLGRLDRNEYTRRFHDDVRHDFEEELSALLVQGCIDDLGDGYRLTRKGFMYSSVIATLFKSDDVTLLESSFVPT